MAATVLHILIAVCVAINLVAEFASSGQTGSPSHRPRNVRISVGWVLLCLALGVALVDEKQQQDLLEAAKSAASRSETAAQSAIDAVRTVTGGDSFCVLNPITVPGKGWILSFSHEGKYPIYEVSARIVDLDRPWHPLGDGERRVEVGNIGTKRAAIINEPWYWPEADTASFNIFLSARNGFFTELLRAKRISGEWKYSVRVKETSGADPKVVFEKLDPQVPIND